MLPGFRFLFATVVLAVSVLVFGLGAAALLRAAHEEFVNLPSWRLAQQPVLAPQFEMSGPTLAMLRIEALAAKPSLDKPRQQAIIRDIPRDLPDAKAAETAAQDRRLSFAAPDIVRQDVIPQDTVKQDIVKQDIVTPQNIAQDRSDAPRETEQVSSPAAPQTEQFALNAQASVVDPAPSEQSATEQASTDEGKTEAVKAAEPKTAETRTAALSEVAKPDAKPADAAAASAPASSESKSFEAKSFEEKSGTTEASEPRSTERVATIDRSTEATASATLPKPVVKKIRRTNVRVIRQRRAAAAIARARAAARARAVQQAPASDPFGLFGTAPRS
jgi:hypothetical protein